MRALSIRQPWAELILRGVKTVEYRSRATRIVGERFWIYASRGRGQRLEFRGQEAAASTADLRLLDSALRPLTSDLPPHPPDLRPLTSDNLVAEAPPAWLVEMARMVRLIEPGCVLPTGVIVGSAIIERVTPPDPAADGGPGGPFRWHLAGVERAATFRKPRGHPQPAWFRPF